MATPSTGAGSFLTKKYGPLVGWQWAAIGGAGIALFYYIRKNQAANSASNLTPAGQGQIDPATGLPYSSEYGPAGGGEVLAPIIIQQGPPSTTGQKGTTIPPPKAKPPIVKKPTTKKPKPPVKVRPKKPPPKVKRPPAKRPPSRPEKPPVAARPPVPKRVGVR